MYIYIYIFGYDTNINLMEMTMLKESKNQFMIKVNESQYKRRGETPNFPKTKRQLPKFWRGMECDNN